MKTNLANVIDSDHLLDWHSIEPLPQKNQEILANELVYSGDNIVQKPLIAWVNDLLGAIRDVASHKDKEKRAAEIANIYHQALHIFIFLADMKSAREICYTQIQLFITWSYKSKNHALLKYVFQPWIDLSRLDRQQGLFTDAMEKLDLLAQQNLVILPELLYDFLQMDHDVNYFVAKAYMVELIKLYLAQKKYAEIIKFAEARKNTNIKTCQSILQEALVIAFANTGQVIEAKRLLTQARSYSAFSHVFLLRECEMKLARGLHSSDLHFLYKQSLHLLNTTQVDIHKIGFGLRTAAVLKKAGLIDDTIKLIYFCLNASRKMNDESLKAECLILLFELITDIQGRNIIEDLMIGHYCHTQYAAVRQRMMSIFDGLQHVERHDECGVAASLFEALLVLADQV